MGSDASWTVKTTCELPVGKSKQRYACTHLHRPVRTTHPNTSAPSGGKRKQRERGTLGRLDRVGQAHKLLEPVLRVPVGDKEITRYSPAWMTTRPPSRTWTLRSCPSRSSIPTRGVLPVASASMSRSWLSHSTVTP